MHRYEGDPGGESEHLNRIKVLDPITEANPPAMLPLSSGSHTLEQAYDKALGVAYDGYWSMAAELNLRLPRSEKIEIADEMLVREYFSRWFLGERKAYVKQSLQNKETAGFMLSVTPNIPVEAKYIGELAVGISGDKKRHELMKYAFYDQYAGEELSGYDPENRMPVIFSLIHRDRQPISGGPLSAVRDELRKSQLAHPFLRTPSVLESLVLLRALNASGFQSRSRGRAAGRLQPDSETVHFDLQPKPYAKDSAKELFVPRSGLTSDGLPMLDCVDISRLPRVRMGVG